MGVLVSRLRLPRISWTQASSRISTSRTASPMTRSRPSSRPNRSRPEATPPVATVWSASADISPTLSGDPWYARVREEPYRRVGPVGPPTMGGGYSLPVAASSSGPRPLRIGMMIVSEYEANPRVRRQAEALAARGDDVTVLALQAEGRPVREIIDGVRVIHTPVRKYRGDSATSYVNLYGGFFARSLAWFVRRPRAYDLVQAHTMPEAVVFSAALQKLAGVPLLLDVHDLTERLFASKFGQTGALMTGVRASTRAALRFADEVLTVHEPYADMIRQWTRRPVSIVMNCPGPPPVPAPPATGHRNPAARSCSATTD